MRQILGPVSWAASSQETQSSTKTKIKAVPVSLHSVAKIELGLWGINSSYKSPAVTSITKLDQTNAQLFPIFRMNAIFGFMQLIYGCKNNVMPSTNWICLSNCRFQEPFFLQDVDLDFGLMYLNRFVSFSIKYSFHPSVLFLILNKLGFLRM